MSILEKVRDFFYDDEYEEEEKIKKPSKQHKEDKEKKIEIKAFKKDKKEVQDISERELFKAERTFNFPFDVEDEEVSVKEEPIIETPPKKEPIYKPVEPEHKQTKPLSIRNYTKYEKEKEEEPEKKFKPTPVISPIYGILDKNYKKEDLLIKDNTEEDNKKLNYETVRKRAYSNVYKDEDNDTKGIFFNLDEEKENKEPEEEVKIIYNDVEEEKEDDKNKTIGEKIEEYEKSLEKEEKEDESDDQILSETKEQDLFNLIDNMYNSDEEDEEEVDE